MEVRRHTTIASIVGATLAAALLAVPLAAQESGYTTPPQAIVDVLDAQPTPGVDFSPDGKRMLLVERPAMPSIAEVAAPWEGLAGMRIDPTLFSRRSLSFATGLSVRSISNTAAKPIALPEGARIAQWRWAPRGDRIGLTLATDTGLELWLADASTGEARRLATGLNAVLGSPFGFVGDGSTLWARLVPEDVAPPPARHVPVGPAVQETSGSSAPLRTIQDLLEDPESEARFEYLATSRFAWIDADTGTIRRVGEPGMLLGTTPSPDGEYVLVERLSRPFSYVLAYWSFPRTIEVWRANGERWWHVRDVPLGDDIPMEGVVTGPRNHQWCANRPATIVWAEAQDGGDPSVPAELRDIWYLRTCGTDGAPREIARLEHRARGIDWLGASPRFVASEYDRDRRWTRTWLFDLENAEAEPVLVEDRSRNDRYGDPGRLVTTLNEHGERVVYERDGMVLRAGPGHSPSGPRPFVSRVAILSGETEVLWRSPEDRYESFAQLLWEAPDRTAFVISSESPTEPTNYLLCDSTTGSTVALTDFADPTPQIRGIKAELLTYERADGVPLSGTLYLPDGYEPGTKLPLVVWAYPLEYTDISTAGQVTNSTTRALRMSGATHLALLLAGYAVLDAATMPIVGDPETMNDTFIEQIVAASQAAIDACVARGVADPDHVVVGGHSYGAFMTANLLAHCDLFRAGIARSGAYNRSLTPFGFQSERRTIWEAPSAYIELSPFFSAHRIDEPLLLIHGEKDSNSGTYPIQSERLFAAIMGNGGTARLVMLPAEDHGYRARESVLHTVAEMLAWCERHVRPEKKKAVEAASEK